MTDLTVGCRIESEGTKGTVKWIGEIPSTEGLWYGIDWDNENRGKHDGSHNGIKYFNTRFEKSGSFVRPSKVNTGMSLEEAIRERYQNDPTIEEELTTQLRKDINARFVEVVGMEKVQKQQSQLNFIQIVVLDGWLIRDGGQSDLSTLLPCIHQLDMSNSLLSSWVEIARITKQLPNLKFLNVSGNMLELPSNPGELVDSMKHLKHVIMNHMLTYSWNDLMLCAGMFPNIRNVQLAFNQLQFLGPVPVGVFELLEDIDVGANPISDWSQICYLGNLPNLQTMNLNNSKLKMIEFPETPPGGKTSLFKKLSSLMIANNPISRWECIGELDKLPSLEDLVLTFDDSIDKNDFFIEFTFARIRNLKMLNRTRVTEREKRDRQLFYLRSFSNEYYANGGTDEPDEAKLTEDFMKKHPSYLAIAKLHGAPMDERGHSTPKSQKLRDLKINLRIVVPNSDKHSESNRNFLPSTRICKVKMMLKRLLNLNAGIKLMLAYAPVQDNESFEISLDNDLQDLHFYAIKSGDALIVRW